MRALIVGLWIALFLSFGVHIMTLMLAVDYMTINHGLMPELAGAISAIWLIFQLYLVHFTDELEQEYM
jgi:hypothetical protein